jgi:hypothetical protein
VRPAAYQAQGVALVSHSLEKFGFTREVAKPTILTPARPASGDRNLV